MKKIGGMYNLKVKDWLVENALKEELQFQQPKSESGIEDLDFPFWFSLNASTLNAHLDLFPKHKPMTKNFWLMNHMPVVIVMDFKNR